MSESPTPSNTAVLDGGYAEYSIADAAVDIDALIRTLTQAKANGAEYIVMESGNHRGARWSSVGLAWDFAEDVEDVE